MSCYFSLRPIWDLEVDRKRMAWAEAAGFKIHRTIDYWTGDIAHLVFAETEKELSLLLLTLPGDLM